MTESGPQTLIEAVRYFSDLQVCFRYMIDLKWPDGKIVCPKCGGDKIGNVASRCLLQCKGTACRKQFSAKLGTIFEDSPLPLSSWSVAVWCIANAKNGISSCELARALGVTQKTAWFMLHRIRLAMRTPTFRRFTDVVETDETFIGGKPANMHAAKRARKITGRGLLGVVPMSKEPIGGKPFDDLARKLIQVPRPEVDREAKKYKAKRRRRKKS